MRKKLFWPLATVLLFSCGESDAQTEESDNSQESVQETVETEAEDQEEGVTIIAKDLDAEAFKAKLDEGEIQLLDVRTAEEVAEGFIEGAVNIDFYAENFADQAVGQLDSSKPVAVYCKAGGRSSSAMEVLTENGFTEVYNLLGGYSEWPY